jgi:amino acid transporter
MKNIQKKLYYLPLVIGGTTYPTPKNLPQGNTVNTFITFGINLLVVIAIIAAIIFILLGAIKWITSGGDKAKIEEAKGSITNAIIGVIVVVMAFVILGVLGQILNVPYLKNLDPRKSRPTIPATLYCPLPGQCTNSCPTNYVHDGKGNCIFEF